MAGLLFMKLSYKFYHRDVVEVAKELLGKTLVWNNFQGIITETEAYRGLDDEASHAFKGITKRTAIMFGPPGYIYVYLIYGIYYCLNIVTQEIGQASAVLIRGLQLPDIHLNGPGKICRHLCITTEHNGINITNHDEIYLTNGIKVAANKIISTPRIGIKKATDKLWRFQIQPLNKIL